MRACVCLHACVSVCVCVCECTRVCASEWGGPVPKCVLCLCKFIHMV